MIMTGYEIKDENGKKENIWNHLWKKAKESDFQT